MPSPSIGKLDLNIVQQELDACSEYVDAYTSWISKYSPSKLTIEECANPVTRRHSMTLARFKAIKKVETVFNLRRSFDENTQNNIVDNIAIQKLELDLSKLYWHYFREEFPTLDDYLEDKSMYSKNAFSHYYNYSRTRKANAANYDKMIRERGKQKRINKENQLRERIGDEEFNRRMKEDKKVKASKGGTDEQYLKFLTWKETAEGKSYNTITKESSHVKPVNASAIYYHGVVSYKKKNEIMRRVETHTEFRKIIERALNGGFPIHLEMVEGNNSSTIPYQYVILENTRLNITSAERSAVVKGSIRHWVSKDNSGGSSPCLLVSFDPSSIRNKYYRTYPKEWSTFEKYKDPVSGKYVGNPNISTPAHKLYQVKGKEMTASIYIPNDKTLFILKTFGHQKVVNETEAVKILNGVTELDDIKSRLSSNIKDKKDQRAKANRNKESKSTNSVDKLISLGNMFENGLITKEEFLRQKQQLNL